MLIGILLTNILVHYIGRQFKCDLHLFIILWKVKWTNATYIIYLHIRPFHLLTFYFPIWREFFFEYIYIHAYILMQILFTHALNCLGMVVALMSHDNLQSWPWPKRFQRDQQPPPPPHLIYWQTLLRHHVNQWEIFGGCNVGGLPSATHKASHPESPQSFGGPVFREFVV